MSFSVQDKVHMQSALCLARKGLGNVWPNPAVGCVIVDRSGFVIARGHTHPGGRPHAEAHALSLAPNNENLIGACAYVTLEPCSHHGQTPPCAQALIDSKISKVIVATSDPDSRVSGRGIEMLKAAGIEVLEGLCQQEADRINAGFFSKINKARPYVTLKVATTLDGFIASKTGCSKWITGGLARARGHLLRSQNDAILIGSGTALADDPSLSCRIEGASDLDQPVRLLLDSDLRVQSSSQLFETATEKCPVWVFHDEKHTPIPISGVEFIRIKKQESGLNINDILGLLSEKGLTRILIEGGGKIAASFLKDSLVDEIHWFRAPVIMGSDGVPAIGGLNVTDLVHMPRFQLLEQRVLGDDVEMVFVKP